MSWFETIFFLLLGFLMVGGADWIQYRRLLKYTKAHKEHDEVMKKYLEESEEVRKLLTTRIDEDIKKNPPTFGAFKDIPPEDWDRFVEEIHKNRKNR